MSKVGKKPITIPAGVAVSLDEKLLEIKGKEGTISIPILSGLKLELKENELLVKSENDELQTRANWGTMRSLAQNAVIGVNAGFTKELEIQISKL